MEKEIYQDYKKAGKIAREALEYGVSITKKGESILNICKSVDKKIIELGGKPAFPTQLSLNDTAAHFCPEDENMTLKDDVVSIDVGVHINGFIGDNAATVDLTGKNEELVKASREALDNAIKIIKPGVKVGEIGKVIHETITSYGFSPVKNLSGHGLDEYEIHTKPNIPNYDNNSDIELKKGDIIAIEPFASNGAGIIYESSNPTIFTLIEKRPIRSMITRQVLKEIEKYDNLPFSKWWLIDKFGKAKVSFALREMNNLEMLEKHPPLIDKEHGLVSQAEHTVLVTSNGCEVLTKE